MPKQKTPAACCRCDWDPSRVEELSCGKLFHVIDRKMRHLGDENLAKHGVTFSQLKILAYVARGGENGTVLQRDLENAFSIRRSSVTQILQNMERGGLLRRENASSDARQKEILLTEKGRELEHSLRDYMDKTEESLLEGFSPEETEALHAFLVRVLTKLNATERNIV